MNARVVLLMAEISKGDLARVYADARVEAELKHTKRFLEDAQQPFEGVKRELAKPATELNSAQHLLEYMKR